MCRGRSKTTPLSPVDAMKERASSWPARQRASPEVWAGRAWLPSASSSPIGWSSRSATSSVVGVVHSTLRPAVEAAEAEVRSPVRDVLGRHAETGGQVGVREGGQGREAIGRHEHLAPKALAVSTAASARGGAAHVAGAVRREFVPSSASAKPA
jgi:hypothetical protein